MAALAAVVGDIEHPQIVGGLVLVVGVALAESARVATTQVTAGKQADRDTAGGEGDPGGFDRDPRGDQSTLPARR